MGHHSQDGPLGTELRTLIQKKHDAETGQKLDELRQALGPTGKFPDGKIAEHDEGEIVFAVGSHAGRVTIDFGKPIHSVGMTAHQAMALAQMLIQKARDANIIAAGKEPLTLEIG